MKSRTSDFSFDYNQFLVDSARDNFSEDLFRPVCQHHADIDTSHTSAPSSHFTPHDDSSPPPAPHSSGFPSASTSSRPYPPIKIKASDLATTSPPLTLAANASYSEGDDVSTTATRPDASGRSSSSRARYDPLAPPPLVCAVRRGTNRRGLRGGGDDPKDKDPDAVHEPMDVGVSSSDIIQHRGTDARRQRESEQRRRDELRDGYAKLNLALPTANQKSSKASLLHQAVTYIHQLQSSHAATQTRLDAAEKELARLRDVNELLLMRNLADSQQHAVTLTELAAARAQQNQSQ